MVGGHVGGSGSGDGGVGDTARMAFIGGRGMGDRSPKVVRFHFSIGYWLGGCRHSFRHLNLRLRGGSRCWLLSVNLH
jgi:hypothetical protein